MLPLRRMTTRFERYFGQIWQSPGTSCTYESYHAQSKKSPGSPSQRDRAEVEAGAVNPRKARYDILAGFGIQPASVIQNVRSDETFATGMPR